MHSVNSLEDISILVLPAAKSEALVSILTEYRNSMLIFFRVENRVPIFHYATEQSAGRHAFNSTSK